MVSFSSTFCTSHGLFPLQPASTRRLRSVTTSAADISAETIPDASVRVKLMLAESTGKLDLSECGLTSIPPQVFDLIELEELSLAGNDIVTLPPEIGRLKSLRRLQLSGNYLTDLPEELGELQALEGLWLHGNLIKKLPESVADLSSLVQLSIAGNELETLPERIGALKALKELTAAGNKLHSLPGSIDGLESLEILGLHGNQLTEMPETIGGLSALKEFWLQGNPGLSTLPSEFEALSALQHFSAADCALGEVPGSVRNSPALKTLSLYGNRLKALPSEILEAPALSGIWLEGNSLDPKAVQALLAAAATANARLAVGLDVNQLEGVDASAISAAGSRLKISEVYGQGPGYFKLEKGPTSPPGGAPAKVLVVAFGSAPGVPNWGGLLRRVRDAATEPEHNDFDVLYIVDPYRGWYGGGDEAEYNVYKERLTAVTRNYEKVVMIGDSMGATASLLFADLATSVHAFCPQVDLAASSIRPAKDAAWGAQLRERIIRGVEGCEGRVTVHVGNWKHDLDQANICPKDAVHVQIYSVNSHRLAIALDRAGKLLPTIRAAILNEMGLSGSNVRVANLF